MTRQLQNICATPRNQCPPKLCGARSAVLIIFGLSTAAIAESTESLFTKIDAPFMYEIEATPSDLVFNEWETFPHSTRDFMQDSHDDVQSWFVSAKNSIQDNNVIAPHKAIALFTPKVIGLNIGVPNGKSLLTADNTPSTIQYINSVSAPKSMIAPAWELAQLNFDNDGHYNYTDIRSDVRQWIWENAAIRSMADADNGFASSEIAIKAPLPLFSSLQQDYPKEDINHPEIYQLSLSMEGGWVARHDASNALKKYDTNYGKPEIKPALKLINLKIESI